MGTGQKEIHTNDERVCGNLRLPEKTRDLFKKNETKKCAFVRIFYAEINFK